MEHTWDKLIVFLFFWRKIGPYVPPVEGRCGCGPLALAPFFADALSERFRSREIETVPVETTKYPFML